MIPRACFVWYNIIVVGLYFPGVNTRQMLLGINKINVWYVCVCLWVCLLILWLSDQSILCGSCCYLDFKRIYTFINTSYTYINVCFYIVLFSMLFMDTILCVHKVGVMYLKHLTSNHHLNGTHKCFILNNFEIIAICSWLKRRQMKIVCVYAQPYLCGDFHMFYDFYI